MERVGMVHGGLSPQPEGKAAHCTDAIDMPGWSHRQAQEEQSLPKEKPRKHWAQSLLPFR